MLHVRGSRGFVRKIYSRLNFLFRLRGRMKKNNFIEKISSTSKKGRFLGAQKKLNKGLIEIDDID